MDTKPIYSKFLKLPTKIIHVCVPVLMMRAGKHTSHLIYVRTVEYNSEKAMIPFKRRYILTLKYPTNYTFIKIIYAVS